MPAPSIADLIGPQLPPEHRELRAIAVSTLFGAFAREGTSGALGNDTDSALLLALREWADCVLVGAGTVRREGYKAPRGAVAVVSRSLDFDTTSDFFSGTPPLIIAAREALSDPALAPARARLRAAGAQLVDAASGSARDVVAALHARGLNRIVCEGGPSLYSALLAADAIDVFHLTVDPSVGPLDGTHLPALGGAEGDGGLRRFTLEAVARTDDSMLFCRYRRSRG
ncbi:dihydrofolate reductase family protein [Corynebacterium liangguodongii]|uniref:Uncharacterized protein n=1 Tax=Corynebacterium liangguodongii TaxID=2079535 RepID=A0A2S0WED3_9CORY|nr:dihydrofolate reductase family protein [Corynebacterium liangguodongii]AWB84135.1 hypothetical protein C3E79_06325 [Corynebacterium liangguodongii]PWC00146.1 hypothetical protein DF219_02965 [Corynebacterium liangguodongii]